MDKIIKFYELNEKNLLNYDTNTINKLYSIITEEKENINNNEWLLKSNNLLEECNEIFSIMDCNYLLYIDSYITKLEECLINNNENKNKYIIRKIKLYIQLLDYLKKINFDKEILFDFYKYNIIINTYDIFFNLQSDIQKCYVKWLSNSYIFFYSESEKTINICIYNLNDIYNYKIFMTFVENKITNKIKICIYNSIIMSEIDFYNKIKKKYIYKLDFINITKIPKYFSSKSDKVLIEYQESNYIDANKMLQFINVFLNN
jgi:hypothetical protein